MSAANKDTPPQAPPNVSPENDLLKRSTDCVYFLASPLTCKKGSECEYRHSETARSNPTDCRYWLSGKCSFNAGCVYRHPPLDALVQPQAGSYAGPSHNAAREVTPCHYFLMGSCMKGSQCTYLHGPFPPPYTKIKPFMATTSAASAPTFKKTFGGPEKNQPTRMNFQSNATKEIEAPRQPQVNAATKAVETEKYHPPLVVAAPPAVNESWRSRAEHSHRASSIDDQNYQNGRDGDDSLRESSPGFDVLVDDKLSEDDYLQNEDNYVRMGDHEERRSSELDMGRHDEYNNSVTDVDHDVYRSKRGFDAYDDLQDRYGRRQRGASSERLSAHDMRVPYNPERPDFIQTSSDLRHRLSKQRRGNSLRSVISHDYKPNYHQEDRDYRNSRRDTRSPMREGSIGKRLQGRINPPRRSSPERDIHGERYLGRSSPSRPRSSALQGRLRDRLGRRVSEENSEGRNFRGPIRRDAAFHANGDVFSGPRRLSEIRGGNERTDRHQPLTGQQSAPSNISFDGPKPLSELLKRKRANNSGALSSSPEETQGYVQKNDQALIENGVEEAEISNKKVKKLIDDEKHPEVEVSLNGGEEVDEEFNQGDEEAPQADEEFDQGDGEYDYEEGDDVEGYNLNETDVADNEGFIDEEEGDDFAKKLGVSL